MTDPGQPAQGDPAAFNPLDGAEGDPSVFWEEVAGLRRVAADRAEPLERRLEAFEDIMESEVGDTSFLRARKLESEFSLRQIYLKFEGGNPTGTQKDRIAFSQVLDAMRRGFDAITLATCGNYGVAAALAASMCRLRCIVYVPETYRPSRLGEIQDLGAEVVRAGGDYEAAVALSSERAAKEELYDANPGGQNTLLQLRAYGEISYEIYDELRDAPAAVAVPVSNGTTLAGIYKGFLSLYRRGKTSRMPRLVAGSAFNKNPIVLAFRRGRPVCEDLPPHVVRESRVNEPLINWHSSDGDHALEALRKSHGWAHNATDRMMTDFCRLLREKEGYHVLPASTAGLIALLERNKSERLPSDRYVAVLTGKKA
ncbi:MAG: pyridoxal-phosphate dependent enzyme [Elusimicrobiota bacterium]